MARNRKPKSNTPNPGKDPRGSFQPDSYYLKQPSWRFKLMDKEVWPAAGCFDEIVDKLSNYETMTWAEIDSASKSSKGSRNHFIKVDRMDKKARERLDELHLTYDEYYSIALTGKARLFGVLESGIFHVLWYDQNHEVCPTIKRHT